MFFLQKWTRYWAVVDNDDLCLYDFTYQEVSPSILAVQMTVFLFSNDIVFIE
jgi:hypothetical protein